MFFRGKIAMVYEFFLSFPDTINNYYVKTQRGVFISKRGRMFREQTAENLAEQFGAGFSLPYPNGTKLRVEVVLYPPDRRKRDQ